MKLLQLGRGTWQPIFWVFENSPALPYEYWSSDLAAFIIECIENELTRSKPSEVGFQNL